MIVEEQGQQCFSCHKTGHKASYLPNACTFHTQNFKLNLMVDMLALKVAEAEYLSHATALVLQHHTYVTYATHSYAPHTQNFKLNLMVDMLALKLAEAEYPQETPGASVSLLGQPAKEAPVQWGVA